MLLEIGEASKLWGVIRSDLERRSVVLEHFSRPPAPEQLAGAILKLAWAVERWLRGKPADDARSPLLLVVCVGRPRRTLARFTELRTCAPSGIYRTAFATNLPVVLVDVRNLAIGPGTAFLRMFDHRKQVRPENARRLFHDPKIAMMTKRQLRTAMTEEAVFDGIELTATFEEAVAIGHKKGHTQGARQALLAIASARLPANAVTNLRGIRDLDRLRERLLELLPGA